MYSNMHLDIQIFMIQLCQLSTLSFLGVEARSFDTAWIRFYAFKMQAITIHKIQCKKSQVHFLKCSKN